MEKQRIIFMGTPDFSVPALQKLAAQDHFEICLVITQPDRPKGRGKKLAPPPVKVAAQDLNLEVIQPVSLKSKDVLDHLQKLSPDFFVVVAFGQILSSDVLAVPKKYPINIHASLLPKYRGASPIQAAILNLEKETGVTTMVMDKGLDTGDILLTSATPIRKDETAKDLHDRLSLMGANLIVETIHQIVNHDISPTPQNHDKATFTKLLKKDDGKINWSQSSQKVVAHINAMTPWPGAFTFLDGQRLKIFKTKVLDNKSTFEPGTVYLCDNEGIHVATGDKTILILELMGSSGKRLTAQEYLRGNKIEESCVFYI